MISGGGILAAPRVSLGSLPLSRYEMLFLLETVKKNPWASHPTNMSSLMSVRPRPPFSCVFLGCLSVPLISVEGAGGADAADPAEPWGSFSGLPYPIRALIFRA